jgi:hypothetical protein
MDTVTTTSRPLTDEEIQAFKLYEFQSKVLDFIKTGKTARFIAVRNCQGNRNMRLVEISQKWVTAGEWHFSIAGKAYYSYKLSDVLHALDTVFNECQIISLCNEIEF